MSKPIDGAAAALIIAQLDQAQRAMQTMVDAAAKTYSESIKGILANHTPQGGSLYIHTGRYAGIIDSSGNHVASTDTDSDCFNQHLKDILGSLDDSVYLRWDLTIN